MSDNDSTTDSQERIYLVAFQKSGKFGRKNRRKLERQRSRAGRANTAAIEAVAEQRCRANCAAMANVCGLQCGDGVEEEGARR